jgi:parallel beta-helix repeat protein
MLVTVLVVSLFLVVNEYSVPIQSDSDEPFLVGVEIGWRANVTECKAVIDEVKNYTNLLVIAHSTITCDEAALNETCDYAYDAGMYLMVYFGSQLNAPYEVTVLNRVQYYPFVWIMKAKERYGDHFLGAYFDDEPGGNVLQRGTTVVISSVGTTSYKDAASSFVQSTAKNMDIFSYFGHPVGISLFTSDFGLYWFDYKGGYDVVLAEFTKNNSRPLQVALCRGAAEAQNKDWGVMITWQYEQPPYIESADELYDDMVFAYNSGAKYVTVYDSTDGWMDSAFTEDHFDAMKKFWDYVQQNPDKHGSFTADTVLVLPEDYGFGFRNPNDTIWGYNVADVWTRKMYDDVHGLLDEYGSSLDIVYSDSEFNDSLVEGYSEVLTWTPGKDANNYPIVNLDTGMGYSTIQEAIGTFATHEGHTILVKAGTYNEAVVVNKPVSLVGEGNGATVICGDNNRTTLNIICDGVNVTGFTIRGDGNVTSGVGNGIALINANNCNISGNTITANNYGIYLQDSGNNTLRNNIIKGNEYNFGVSSSSLSNYINDVDTSNMVDGKPICYWVNKHDSTVPSDVGYVALVNCTNISAQNLQLNSNYNGLLVAYTQNSTITDNTLANNWEGMKVDYSTGNVFTGNDMQDNRYNFGVSNGLANDVDSSNTVNDKPVIYWVNQHNKAVPSNAGCVILINCTDITVQNLQLSNNNQGILLVNTKNTTITQNIITNHFNGIELDASQNNTITGNIIEANGNSGISALYSDDNSFVGNKIIANTIGINVNASSINSIHRNHITANTQAIQFRNSITKNSTYNTVTENNIELNNHHINIEYEAHNNTVYHNNFIDNTDQISDTDPYIYYGGPVIGIDITNFWDNGSEGN